MIPFHKIYSWLFKSFFIGEETALLKKLYDDGYTRMMLIKRSWIYIFFVSWIPILLVILSGISIWIAYDSIDIAVIKYPIIVGNILMNVILFPTTILYIVHFRDVHREASVTNNPLEIIEQVKRGDQYFIRYFNWSLTNQFVLIILLIVEIIMMVLFGGRLGQHFWILTLDIFVICTQIYFLKMFRAKMINLEMDFNVAVPGKLYTVNQTGILSNTQTLDGDKIKTVRATFPSKIASFFNYGNIDILTEGDEGTLGAITLYYVTSPKAIANDMENMLSRDILQKANQTIHQAVAEVAAKAPGHITTKTTPMPTEPQHKTNNSGRHSLDTREKIRDILR